MLDVIFIKAKNKDILFAGLHGPKVDDAPSRCPASNKSFRPNQERGRQRFCTSGMTVYHYNYEVTVIRQIIY